MPWVCLHFVIVVFTDHTHLLFQRIIYRINLLSQISFTELTRSMLHNDVSAIDKLLNTISKVGCSQQLEAEVSSAGLLLQRLNSQRKLVLDDLTSSLHKSDITELRSLCNPPQMVVQCVTATMMLIGVKEKQAVSILSLFILENSMTFLGNMYNLVL